MRGVEGFVGLDEEVSRFRRHKDRHLPAMHVEDARGRADQQQDVTPTVAVGEDRPIVAHLKGHVTRHPWEQIGNRRTDISNGPQATRRLGAYRTMADNGNFWMGAPVQVRCSTVVCGQKFKKIGLACLKY